MSDLKIAAPRVPCRKCLNSPAAGAWLAPARGRVFVCWCSHVEAGAVLARLDTGDQWRVLYPIGRDAFADWVLRNVESAVELLDGAGLLGADTPTTGSA